MTSRLAVLAFLLAGTALSSSEERPQAPRGYAWQPCPAARAELLVPSGWQVHEAGGEQHASCTISPEPIVAGKPPLRGIVLTLLRNVPEKSGLSADQFASRLTEELSRRTPGSRRGAARRDPFFAYRVELTLEEEGGRVRLHQLALANPLTGSVYLVTVRGPEAEWTGFWKQVVPILDRLGLDPEA